MIKLSEVGAFPSVSGPGQFDVRFGLYLPGIRGKDNFAVTAKVIHSADRFDPNVPAVDTPLEWQEGHALDLWTATVPLPTNPASNFGKPGAHFYRYQLTWTPAGGSAQIVTPWITDPFAREAEIGRMSAFTLDEAPAAFEWNDDAYKTPELDDLVVYELQVQEFNDTFDGVVDRLVYLKSLGVNCLELMPVTSIKLDFDWGYGPLHYFAPNRRLGGGDGLKRLVDAAHAQGMAVILDVVYEHVDVMFAYFRVYTDLSQIAAAPRVSSPMMDGMNIFGFGPKPDFTVEFAQKYFLNVNQHWLDEYHVDGFRYDEITELYAPPMDAGYRSLTKETYKHSLTLPRFQRPTGGYSRIIQCAEALSRAATVMRETHTNCAWQNDLLFQAEGVAGGGAPSDQYAHVLDPSFMGYPGTTTVEDADGAAVEMPVAPFQYIESHDHSQLIVFAGVTRDEQRDPAPEGDRSLWYKLQPHAIALYTLQGIPMLWQGQEFADNYSLPDSGLSKVHLERVTHWEYFYDDSGSPLVGLYRRLGNLRRSVRALRSRSSFYFFQQSLQNTQVLIYSRHAAAAGAEAESWALVLLNFANGAATVNAPFPVAGRWREMLDDGFRPAHFEVEPGTDGATLAITVPSNYGQVWVKVA